jgi:hypothetical protein
MKDALQAETLTPLPTEVLQQPRDPGVRGGGHYYGLVAKALIE